MVNCGIFFDKFIITANFANFDTLPPPCGVLPLTLGGVLLVQVIFFCELLEGGGERNVGGMWEGCEREVRGMWEGCERDVGGM